MHFLCGLDLPRFLTRAAFLLVLIAGQSRRAEAVAVQASFNLGKPFVFVTTEEVDVLSGGIRPNLGAAFALGGDIQILANDLPIAYGVYFESFWKSDYGLLANGSSGLTLTYYPFTRPYRLDNVNSRVGIQQSGITFYISVGAGLAFFNYHKSDASEKLDVGSAAFHLKTMLGVDYPVSDTLLGGVLLTYTTTFLGEDASIDDPSINNVVAFDGIVIGARLGYLMF